MVLGMIDMVQTTAKPLRPKKMTDAELQAPLKGLLTEAHRIFCAEYAKHGIIKAAAESAGIHEVTGNRWIQNETIIKEIKRQARRIEYKYSREASDVLLDIVDISKECRDEGDKRTALKGLELEGKYHKMFVDRLEHSGGVDVNAKVQTIIIDFANMTDEQLAKLERASFWKGDVE